MTTEGKPHWIPEYGLYAFLGSFAAAGGLCILVVAFDGSAVGRVLNPVLIPLLMISIATAVLLAGVGFIGIMIMMPWFIVTGKIGDKPLSHTMRAVFAGLYVLMWLMILAIFTQDPPSLYY